MNYKSLYKSTATHVIDTLTQQSAYLYAGIMQIITEHGRKIVYGRYFILNEDESSNVVRTFQREFTNEEAVAIYNSLSIQASNHFDHEQELYDKALLAIILQEQILGLTQASDWELIVQ